MEPPLTLILFLLPISHVNKIKMVKVNWHRHYEMCFFNPHDLQLYHFQSITLIIEKVPYVSYYFCLVFNRRFLLKIFVSRCIQIKFSFFFTFLKCNIKWIYFIEYNIYQIILYFWNSFDQLNVTMTF